MATATATAAMTAINVTQDFRSTIQLYRAAWMHTVSSGFVRLLGPACTTALVLFASAVMHGYHATAFMDKPPDKSIALRWETILRVSVSLLLDAIVRLPVSVWIFRVAFTLWVQLHWPRRVALLALAAKFERDDWAGFVLGMTTGQPVHEAMRTGASTAHHERA